MKEYLGNDIPLGIILSLAILNSIGIKGEIGKRELFKNLDAGHF